MVNVLKSIFDFVTSRLQRNAIIVFSFSTSTRKHRCTLSRRAFFLPSAGHSFGGLHAALEQQTIFLERTTDSWA